MAYGSNVLKTESAYYIFKDASITSGKLSISGGGWARQDITIADLPLITDTMLFRCICTPYNGRYTPKILVKIHMRNASTADYTVVQISPVLVSGSTFECTFSAPSGSYTEMYIEISSHYNVEFTLWELCPETNGVDTKTIINGVSQALPRLIYDYNTYELGVTEQETIVAFITCILIQETDLQGHFLCTFTATKATTLVVRFYDNEAEELYCPILYDINVGLNTIGIPHAYISRKAGTHSYVVTMQAYQGSLKIEPRNVLYTIDGGYLATRAIDIALDVCDIAIRQISAQNGPDTCWIVGLNAGECLVRYRNYTETDASVGWTAAGSLGKAISASIEFNGVWELPYGKKYYTIVTEELPYVFVVTEANELYAYHGVEDDNPELLSSEAVYVKSCLGYSSQLYPEQDQGLICAYIKTDGTVWYRQRLHTGVTAWQPEVQLSAEAWEHMNVSRLNDYRVSFQLSNADHNLFMYTGRTYVGQAVRPEFAEANASVEMYYGGVPSLQIADYSTSVEPMDETGTSYELKVVLTPDHQLKENTGELTTSNFTFTDSWTNPSAVEFNSEYNTLTIHYYNIGVTSLADIIYRPGTVTFKTDSNFAAYYDSEAGDNGDGWAFNLTTQVVDLTIDKRQFLKQSQSENAVANVSVAMNYQQTRNLTHSQPAEQAAANVAVTMLYNQTSEITHSQPAEKAAVNVSVTMTYSGTSVKPI